MNQVIFTELCALIEIGRVRNQDVEVSDVHAVAKEKVLQIMIVVIDATGIIMHA